MQYSFASAPRPVATRTKGGKSNNAGGGLYRKAAGTNSEGTLRNMMFDHRIVRGNTYSGIVVPGNNVQQQQQPGGSAEARKSRRRGKRRVEPKSIFDLRPEMEKHDRVDLAPYLVDQSEAPEVHEELTQTDRFTETPPPEPYIPLKTGIDASTQIEPEDNLFKFDEAVVPLLDVLVGKTVEQALQEVQEEEELRSLYERKSELIAAQEVEAQRLRSMENREVELWNAKEKKRLEEVERERREADLEQKVWAAYTSKNIVDPANVDDILSSMQEAGHKDFRDPVQVNVEEKFMPWILDMVSSKMGQVANSRRLVDSALQRALDQRQEMEQEAELERQAAAEAAAAPRLAMEEAQRKGTIRIFVDGIDGVDQVGPIPVKATDTIEEVEAKIQEFIRGQIGDSFTPPEGGVLKLAFEGSPLANDATILDANVADMAHVDVVGGRRRRTTTRRTGN